MLNFTLQFLTLCGVSIYVVANSANRIHSVVDFDQICDIFTVLTFENNPFICISYFSSVLCR